MDNQAYLEQVAKDQRAVDDFYNESLKTLEERIRKNTDKVEKLRNEEEEMIETIEKLRKEIDDINNDEGNHVENNKNFRLKNFSLEKKIFDKENLIKKLKKELEWKKKMNAIEIQFLKDKNDSIVNDYEKLYNEREEIDKAIIVGVLRQEIAKIGDVINAKELRNENDNIFRNLQKGN